MFSPWICVATDFETTSGRVVGADGKAVENATVCELWRSNGSYLKSNGESYDLSKEAELAQFWGNLGDMQAFSPRQADSSSDGSFVLQRHGRSRLLMAIDSTRELGGIVSILDPSRDREVEIRLAPLVTVSGRMALEVNGEPAYWSHVYVELPRDERRPLATNRILSCGSFEGEIQFRLPPGEYVLDAYAISQPGSEEIDLHVATDTTFSIEGSQKRIDLGTLSLTKSPPRRPTLESEARAAGRWRDFRDHYGEPAPHWNAIDARGIPMTASIRDFRGKWLMINFWGLSCAPCLAKGIPEMIEFYEKNASLRDKFEIVGVCIDFEGELSSLNGLDSKLAPVVSHVWGGKKIEYPVVLDDTFQTWERFGIPGLGTVVLVDPDGKLYQGDASTLQRILDGSHGKPNNDLPK